ncbi:MAG: hypothetical protein ABWX61_07365 [Paenisporosarcina sp.]
MRASQEILNVWQKFDDKPMDTLMKLWWSKQEDGGGQRSVSLIKDHFAEYGVAGNCVDLSLWLIEEFRESGIEAYGIVDDLNAERAHVAVIAFDQHGRKYLCDLGDQWIQPIWLNENPNNPKEWLDGYFPAAKIQQETVGCKTKLLYQRPNGKVTTSIFDTTPLEDVFLWDISERVQQVFRKSPLVEIRLPINGEIAHWEFDNWTSFLSTSEKLIKEDTDLSLEEWIQRIHSRTGMNKEFLDEALRYYKELDQ